MADEREGHRTGLPWCCVGCVVPFSPRSPCAYTGSVHRWLLDKPGILHCDLYHNNVTYRIIEKLNARREAENKVYKVPTNEDISSWATPLVTDYTTNRYPTFYGTGVA